MTREQYYQTKKRLFNTCLVVLAVEIVIIISVNTLFSHISFIIIITLQPIVIVNMILSDNHINLNRPKK